MKSRRKIWLLLLGIVALATASTMQRGAFDQAVPSWLARLDRFGLDLKFEFRGPVPPKNHIVLVNIDEESLAQVGRWPWHRDAMASLLEKIFSFSPKVVGLDITFSEPDGRVHEGLKAILSKRGEAGLAQRFETDALLAQVVRRYRDHLVLGWSADQICNPGRDRKCASPDEVPTYDASNDFFTRFGFDFFLKKERFTPEHSLIRRATVPRPNLRELQNEALFSGYFGAEVDPDGTIRTEPLAVMVGSRPYPTLAFEMARAGLHEKSQLTLGTRGEIESLGFIKSSQKVPVSGDGLMRINFRGGAGSFVSVSALDLIESGQDKGGRMLASLAQGLDLKQTLNDAYVLVGLTAVGAFDMRSFPFGGSIPGVEGQATILDNLLAGDALKPANAGWTGFLFFVMTAGVLAMAWVSLNWLASLGLLAFFGLVGVVFFVDTQILFKNGVVWETSVFYVESLCVFLTAFLWRHFESERNKAFLRTAFSKYVSPSVVEEILKDPNKLALRGERREMTVLFSDIRDFTRLSEKLDPQLVTSFLNDFFGMMTQIILEEGGTLDKYIGDCVMAFWGAPLPQKDHADRALKASIRMQEMLSLNRARFLELYGFEVLMGIGLNTGMVSVGNMGCEQSFGYTAIGDAVNLASRVENLTKLYGTEVLLTAAVRDHSRESNFKFLKLDRVRVKGRSEAVDLYRFRCAQAPEADELYEKALSLYQEGNWEKAAVAFEEAAQSYLSKKISDFSSQAMKSRCIEFAKNPPALDWNGTFDLDLLIKS